jgi:KRAB domain-containing zinc finger protein
MKEHYQRVHCEERPFRCDVCDKSFAIQTDFKRHKIMHSEERPYDCEVCNMSFRYLNALKEHMFRHNNDYHIPVICVVKVLVFRAD